MTARPDSSLWDLPKRWREQQRAAQQAIADRREARRAARAAGAAKSRVIAGSEARRLNSRTNKDN
jgi:hypothetical protein